MASVIHIAEIAAILAVAYMLGWLVGYVARRLMAPGPVVIAAIPEARLAAATGADALVKAPIIAPVARPAADTPAPEPVAEIAEPAVAAEPASAAPEPPPVAPEPAPAIVEPAPAPMAVESAAPSPQTDAGVTDSTPAPEPAAPAIEPVSVAGEPPETPIQAAPVPGAARRSFRRFRAAARAAEPAPVADPVPAGFTATPASQPGLAWTGEIKGRSASKPQSEPPAPVATEGPPAAPAKAAAAPAAEPVAVPEPAPAPAQPVAAAADPEPADDEDAAMRAIEGGWSRVGARAMAGTPELSDMGAAVAAATTAVEQVLARAGIDVDSASQGVRPKGLARPRNGLKDDLKRIVGLGALDESTLNNLGVYHFDQIAGWNDAQVLWMENHVFARGRIGREEWQRQARDLAVPPAA